MKTTYSKNTFDHDIKTVIGLTIGKAFYSVFGKRP